MRSSREKTGVGSPSSGLARHGLICGVTDRVHVDLELEAGSEPIAGQLATAGEQPTTFVGWMQLTRLLDRIVRRNDAERRHAPAT